MARHTSAHPLDTEILDLVEGTLERAEEERILAHLSICLLCRIKRQRLSAAAPVEFSDPRDLVTPAFAHIEVRHEDGSAARAGELWLTADDDGGMVLVRKVRSSGLVVVPVTLDVEVADDETLVLDEAASPLGLPLAIYERLMVSIPFSAISGRVIPKLDRIDLLALSSDSVGASRGSAIDGSTDPRLEIRQYLTDRLTALDNPDDEGSPGDSFVFDQPSIEAGAPVTVPAPPPRPALAVTPPPPARPPASRPAPARPAAPGDKSLSKAEAAILNVLAQFPGGRTKVQLALLSKYSIKSSSLGNALGALRSAGYVEKGGSPIRATAEGVAAAGDVEPLPTGDELFRYWCSQLSKAEVAILTVMVDRYPADVTKEELAAATSYSASSSSMGNALGRLRSLELVTGWHANEDFVAAIR